MQSGFIAGLTSAALYGVFMGMKNSVTLIGPALTGFGAGAAYALGKSPQCQEVRKAINFWTFFVLSVAAVIGAGSFWIGVSDKEYDQFVIFRE